MAQSRRKQLEKLEITEAPKDETNQLKFRFEYDVEPWNELVMLKNLSIKIGERTLLEPFTYTVCRGQRLKVIEKLAGAEQIIEFFHNILGVRVHIFRTVILRGRNNKGNVHVGKFRDLFLGGRYAGNTRLGICSCKKFRRTEDCFKRCHASHGVSCHVYTRSVQCRISFQHILHQLRQYL